VPVINVWNKLDEAPPADSSGSVGSPSFPDSVGSAIAAPSALACLPGTSLALSAKTGAGLAELRQTLLQQVGWTQQSEGLFIARARHVQALADVDAHLQLAAEHVQPGVVMLDLMAEELRLAQQALAAITGEFSADDLLGSIFSTFCIGK
jgi:tRNA modification GTPase